MYQLQMELQMVSSQSNPMIIQGGMGVAVSSWSLARAVAKTGQLGVVSGTALAGVLTRRLQMGDLDGDYRLAMSHFPDQEISQRLLDRFYVPGGKSPEAPYVGCSMPSIKPGREYLDCCVVGNFIEVWLGKHGHSGEVGINFLEKIQLPTLPSLYGAMLADADYILMGAGIPRHIPGILDQLSRGEAVEMPIDVEGAPRNEPIVTRFDPSEFLGREAPQIARPRFLAIVSSPTLATALVRKSNGHIDGFVVEGPSAGGHNAPPRGVMQLNDDGEPIYGERDKIDLEAFRKMDRPFWLAGSYGRPEKLKEALEAGAEGVQVGTAFAFCEESGLREDVKTDVLAKLRRGELRVFTDPKASPTGFPFKVLDLPDTLADKNYDRDRFGRPACDLGYLRKAYIRDDGKLGWRCASENEDDYVRKGGDFADTIGRKCMCNALLANVGLEQQRDIGEELPMITCGDDINEIVRYMPKSEGGYSAASVIEQLLAGIAEENPKTDRGPRRAA